MTSGTSASAGGARAARTLHGLSPCSKSVRTQTAHFVSHTSYIRPKVDVIPSCSLRTRGFIRGSIPLSSTIKRLVRRGSGKANGQKPKMYGHADRIARQDRGSGKLPTLLDCCVLTAYSCPMTTSKNTQRDELRGADEEQTELWRALRACDPSPSEDTLYDTWASALLEAGVRVVGGLR